MKKSFFALCFCLLALAAMPASAICQSSSPLTTQIQAERPSWIPVGDGAIKLAGDAGVFNFSIWRNAGSCLLVVLHCRILKEDYHLVHKIHGSGGNNWIVDSTNFNGVAVTVLTTFIYDSGRRDAVNEVIGKLEKLGKITRCELTG